ncbi:hypothetical protein [Cohnella sp. GbtcB17]|uniref:hypothetical protein n=1 Tax=Cohnella sp. GbtcB17 TaxID=2824762 RepID=UPI001C2F5E6E|nr:hypothetical protein [Cohnella sp. GbtcB17]
MDQILKQILEEIVNLKAEVQQISQNQLILNQNQSQTALQVNSIYQAIVRLEDGQPKDIFALLEKINTDFFDKEAEIAALNKRVFRLESDFEKFNRQ